MTSTELKQHQDILREALKNLIAWDEEDVAKGLHILSVEIGLGNGKSICISTLYRVGTLGAENHRAVDSYLRNLAMRKKYSNIILIGDINLNQVTWPLSGNITSRIQGEFLETFDGMH